MEPIFLVHGVEWSQDPYTFSVTTGALIFITTVKPRPIAPGYIVFQDQSFNSAVYEQILFYIAPRIYRFPVSILVRAPQRKL
jgi:hypothetical protein